MKKAKQRLLFACAFCASIFLCTAAGAAEKSIYYAAPMNGEGCSIEAESAVRCTDSEILKGSSFSGGAAVKLYGRGDDKKEQNPSLLFSFDVNKSTLYSIWLRVNTGQYENTLLYDLYGDGEYAEKKLSASDNIRWVRLGTAVYAKGVKEIRIIPVNSVTADKIIVTSDTEFIPSGASAEPPENYSSSYFLQENIGIFPQKGVHPRLYAVKADIPAIRAKLESDTYKAEYKKIQINANKSVKPLPKGGSDYTDNTSCKDILLDRAFSHLIGDSGREHAKETVNQMKSFLKTVTFDKSNTAYKSRYIGETLNTAACVYDWCYDFLTEKDKQFFVRRMKELAKETEVGYPAVKRSYVTAHAPESLIYRDQLSVGIAIYDEEEDWYQNVMSIISERLLPVKNFLNSSLADFSGSTYTEARNTGAVKAEFMLGKLGLSESIFCKEYKDVFYKFIYTRLPNGIWFKEGDDYAWDRYVPDTRSPLYGDIFSYTGSRYGDPYLLRQGLLDNTAKNEIDIFNILATDLNADIKEPTELPLTHFTKYPMSSMTARTSWQNGLNAPTAMAYVNMREVTVGDHQHRDMGAFQLWYKGMLALDSGLYEYGEHYGNYQTRSIAHNSVTVTDPGEVYETYAADGGQRAVKSFGSYGDMLKNVSESIESGECITAKDVKTFYGGGEYSPVFSYISGNIAPAYTDKIKSYERSFVFINTKNTAYSAALLVLDDLEAASAEFKKKWLLHSQEEPVISESENKITIKRTDNGQNGMLVNKTLIPEIGGAAFEKVGGSGKEYYVEGKNYSPSRSENGLQFDAGAWRVELSPKSESAKDKFLNVMYVTDADGTAEELPVFKDEGESFVSVTLLDKTVVFPKNKKTVTQGFTVNVRDNGFSEADVLLCGLSPGKWSITKSGKTECAEVSESGGCAYFKLAPGEYTTAKTDGNETVTAYTFNENKEDFGDFLIRKNNNLMYIPKKTVLCDNVPYVALDGIFTQLGAEIVYKSADKISFNAGNKTYTAYAGGTAEESGTGALSLKYPIKVFDGEFYASPEDFKKPLNLSNIKYDEKARLLIFSWGGAAE